MHEKIDFMVMVAYFLWSDSKNHLQDSCDFLEDVPIICRTKKRRKKENVLVGKCTKLWLTMQIEQ